MNPDCKQIRKEILTVAKLSGHGHIPSSFSVVEIIYAIYDTITHDPKDPCRQDRDIFILSKGHASLAHYCVLSKFGYFEGNAVYTPRPKTAPLRAGMDCGRLSIPPFGTPGFSPGGLHSFGSFMSNFGCHAHRFKVPGIEVSTGSLGHGIGVAVGAALGIRIKKSAQRVFVLIGDGESNEGSVWEAVMVAANLKLDNLTIVYDNNMSHARGLQIPNPGERLKAFGCQTSEINGHDVAAIKTELLKKSSAVKAIVAHTKKGFGCRTLVCNQYEWSRKAPNDREFVRLMEELDEDAI